MTCFSKTFKKFILRRKFLMTFLVIDRILSDFCLSLLSISYFVTYLTLFLPKYLDIRTKHSFLIPFLISLYFATHPITLLLEILGGRMHGPSPPQWLGDCPPVPLSLRPWSARKPLSIEVCISWVLTVFHLCDQASTTPDPPFHPHFERPTYM